MRFADYAERWRKDRLHHRSSSAERVEQTFRLTLIPTFGHLPLSMVTRAHVQTAVGDWSERLAPATVHFAYGYASAVFSSAVLDRLIDVSPCVRINLPEKVHERVVPLTVEQVERIREAMPAWYRAAVTVGAATGMRQGELRGLTVDRIVNGVVLIDRQMVGVDRGRPVFGPPKSKHGVRRVTLGAAAAAAAAEHAETFGLGPEGLLFSNRRRNPLARSDMGHTWREATKGMGLKPRSGWHELRHFNASALIAAGLSVRAVADRLGDRPAEIMATYLHLWPNDQERAASAIDGLLG